MALAILGHFINGVEVEDKERTGLVFNPALGRPVREVAMASKACAETAIAAAQTAFDNWRSTPLQARIEVLAAFFKLLERDVELLAAMYAEEQGCMINYARAEIKRGIEVVAKVCETPEGFHEQGLTDTNTHTRIARMPLGVVALINASPRTAEMILGVVPIALACGNTMVVKASAKTPSLVLKFAQLLQEAGVPAGVVNVINGDKEAVDTLLIDPRVKVINFMGSTPVANYVYGTAATYGKRVVALGGRKNYAYVAADANLDSAVAAIASAAFSQHTDCARISSVVVAESIADRFVTALQAKMTELKLGNNNDATSNVGPIGSQADCDSVAAYVEVGIREGARLVVDGRGPRVKGCEEGFFVAPTLFDQVRTDMRIHREEIRGPVLTVLRVTDMTAAVEIVNGHETAAAITLFSDNAKIGAELASKTQLGNIRVNDIQEYICACIGVTNAKRLMGGDLYAFGTQAIQLYTRAQIVSEAH